jgi:serine/threonine-protein kinase
MAVVQALRPGLVLEHKYRIKRHLADGGMGAVYEGEHVELGRRVAVKVLHPEFARNPDFVARFRKEAQAASAIGHQHIVDILDLGSTGGGAFIVMELLVGQNLADRMVALGGRFPVGRAAHVIHQVLEAVAATHRRGIVHRDLKPENVFLVQRGTDPDFVKVLDFGIAKALVDHSGQGPGGKMGTTGQVLGTPYYMAPEQTRGAATDHRVDIYAAGALLYQLVTGQLPFTAPNVNALLFEIAGGNLRPPLALVPDLPPALDAAIRKAMALSPDDRFASAELFAAAVAPLAEAALVPVTDGRGAGASARLLGSTAILGGGIRQHMPPLTRRRFAVIALIGTVLGLGAGWWTIALMDRRAQAREQAPSRAPRVSTLATADPGASTTLAHPMPAEPTGGALSVIADAGPVDAAAPAGHSLVGVPPPVESPAKPSERAPVERGHAAKHRKVTLRLAITPVGAPGLMVLIDGEPTAERSVVVRAGQRVEVRARARGFALWKQSVTVKHDQTLVIGLEKTASPSQ